MEIIKTPLQDCYIIKANLFGDERGFFMESFNQKNLQQEGIDFDVKQVNFAKSSKGVLRGLHYQKGDYSQAKLVGVVSGSVLDVVVDIRPESETYLQHFKLEINSPDILFLVPRGFAHGYRVLEDDTIFHYAVDNFYAPDQEGGMRYDDPKLNIDWGSGLDEVLVSAKDLVHPLIEI
ncbi:dTDP-4-dehydrorhamnose 3,5-epimerase [Marinoscillum sp. MHG1-6]|uniref:dTDP-4-dehydrorhamnose 3,5-epimerase n=1 Tax=Marinoscillum sp. MHG1-6 TaxID=2959627 RepID=UPI002157BAD6|nr:dTDP-4-dehydrorhamnose 3,5-epimerase [Marinoscillum sp. MHG1-6]